MNVTTNSNMGRVDEERARGDLFEKLSRVQGSLPHRAPVQEVLKAITTAVRDLFEDDLVGHWPIDTNGRPALREVGLKAGIAAPVYQGDKVIGCIVVASFSPERRYSDFEQEALRLLAASAGAALTDATAGEVMQEDRRSKEMFFAMASHELKSPLTVIVGSLYTLRKHPTTLDPVSYESIVDTACDRALELQRLINRMLEGARAELARRADDVVLSDVIQDATKGFEQVATLLVGDVPERVVRVDASAVGQIVGILIENAVSHAPAETGITVDGAIEGSEVALSVRNPGRLPEGMDRDALFVPFKRGDNPKSQGVGLGLYIASQLAKSIGGRITVESVDGFVEFCLRFPLVTASATVPAERVEVRR